MDVAWKKVKEESVKDGHWKILKRTFIHPNGHEHTYDILDSPESCCVVAFTPDNQILLERLFRPGPEKVLLDLPGGRVEEGEIPQYAMARELLEEIGYKADTWEYVVGTIDDAYRTCVRHCFVAKGCKKVQEPKLEEGEGVIEVTTVSLEEFRALLRTGQMCDVESGYLALDYLNLL